MNILKSLIVCFSMYSIIPMPKVDWDKNSMKYTFCFFPFVGAVIGLVLLLWFWLASFLSLNVMFFASVATIIPVIISGGIHMDGYIDTCDAIFSYGDTQKKLEILKDPRTGAFGVIGCVVLLLLQFGVYSQIKENPKFILIVAIGFFLSRCIGGVAVTTMKTAKDSGLAYIFSNNADKNIVKVTLILLIIISFLLIAMLNVVLAIVIICTLILLVIWFNFFCSKQFGGVTGDLIGFIITLTECCILIICAIGGVLC